MVIPHYYLILSGSPGMDVIATIPDMGMDFGFGPPVLHGTYSHTDTPPDTSVVEATDEHAGWGFQKY